MKTKVRIVIWAMLVLAFAMWTWRSLGVGEGVIGPVGSDSRTGLGSGRGNVVLIFQDPGVPDDSEWEYEQIPASFNDE